MLRYIIFFFVYLRDHHNVNDCLLYVFQNKAETVRAIHGQFSDDVN
jgi:hypothetical protein